MSGKQRNLRKRATSEEPSEDEAAGEGVADVNKDKLQQMRQLQQLRRRHAGVGAARLAVGAREDSPGPGPLGSVEAEGYHGKVMEAYVKAKTLVDTQEEDPHMQKYIEAELAKRLGKTEQQLLDEENDPEFKRRKLEAELYSVPEDFRSIVEPEAALPGLVATLSEVPLTAKDKLRGIQQTEALKRKLLKRIGLGKLEEEVEAEQKAQQKVDRGQYGSGFGKRDLTKKKTPEEIEEVIKQRQVIGDPSIKRKYRR